MYTRKGDSGYIEGQIIVLNVLDKIVAVWLTVRNEDVSVMCASAKYDEMKE